MGKSTSKHERDGGERLESWRSWPGLAGKERVAVLAARFGVRPPTLRAWVAAGKVPSAELVRGLGPAFCVALPAEVEPLAVAYRAQLERERATVPQPARVVVKVCRAGLEPDPLHGSDPCAAVAAIAVNGLGDLLTPHDRAVLAARRERFEALRQGRRERAA